MNLHHSKVMQTRNYMNLVRSAPSLPPSDPPLSLLPSPFPPSLPPPVLPSIWRLTSQCPQPDTGAEVSAVGGQSQSWGEGGGGGQTLDPDSACTESKDGLCVKSSLSQLLPGAPSDTQSSYRGCPTLQSLIKFGLPKHQAMSQKLLS